MNLSKIYWLSESINCMVYGHTVYQNTSTSCKKESKKHSNDEKTSCKRMGHNKQLAACNVQSISNSSSFIQMILHNYISSYYLLSPSIQRFGTQFFFGHAQKADACEYPSGYDEEADYCYSDRKEDHRQDGSLQQKKNGMFFIDTDSNFSSHYR